MSENEQIFVFKTLKVDILDFRDTWFLGFYVTYRSMLCKLSKIDWLVDLLISTNHHKPWSAHWAALQIFRHNASASLSMLSLKAWCINCTMLPSGFYVYLSIKN